MEIYFYIYSTGGVSGVSVEISGFLWKIKSCDFIVCFLLKLLLIGSLIICSRKRITLPISPSIHILSTTQGFRQGRRYHGVGASASESYESNESYEALKNI